MVRLRLDCSFVDDAGGDLVETSQNPRTMKTDGKTPWGEPAYYTSIDGSMAIMREFNRIEFEKKALEWFQRHAPLVVKELRRQGVKFPS